MSEEQKKALETQLWNIANTLRGKMDADEFRDYILGFIFYKYLSEKMEDYANEILIEDNLTYFEIVGSPDEEDYLQAIKEESIEKLGYFLRPEELFTKVASRGNGTANNFILEDLTSILRNIEQTTMGTESEDDFNDLFSDMDLSSNKLGKTVDQRNKLIVQVLTHLDKINFELKNHDRDVLGDAYEYLIGQFAAGAGKKAGEFYTPQQVSSILAKIVTAGKSKLKSVYDPTCGSGSLLLRVAKEVEDVSNFYGQELNRTTYNLARMNMIMHDVHYRKFDIKQEDTLEHPQHLDHRFEAIVANPPFSAQWSANDLFMSDDRFSQYGKLAPSSKADFAFVQHMIHHLDENGTMAIVLPHGVLFRGSSEGHIRQYLIEDRNYLDAVIGLPANIFYGTSIPTCILVFKKCREDSDNVLFIDASNEFEKAKNQNYLTSENIEKIIDTYASRTEIEKYSHLASMDEIKENDYNLNIPRYVEKHNKTTLSDTEFDRILNHLNKGNVFEKAKILRDKFALIKDDGDTTYIEFMDTEHWCQNLFQVTQQVTIEGKYKNRYDVTILINGLPLVQIELKRRGLELKEAFNQINRYQRHSYGFNSGLFHYVQIFVISNGVNTKYYSNNKKQTFKQTFFWADKNNKNITNLEEFTSVFLEKCHISKMIAKYIVLAEVHKILMVLRPYQYYAVEAIVDRVKNTNKNGYIWHTTGSGKTLTSFKASQMSNELLKWAVEKS